MYTQSAVLVEPPGAQCADTKAKKEEKRLDDPKPDVKVRQICGIRWFALSAPPYVFYLPSIHPSQGVSVRTRIARLDFVGYLLGADTWVKFLLAISMAGGNGSGTMEGPSPLLLFLESP